MKIAIVTAQGLGDGLQMMIAANHLKKNGHDITVYNRHLSGFGDFFKDFNFKYPFNFDAIDSYDCILLEHDNSDQSHQIVSLSKNHPKLRLVSFIMSHHKSKHGPINDTMFCFDRKKTMLKNIVSGTKTMFSIKKVTFENGISIPKNLIHKKNSKDIIIHPTAGHFSREWGEKNFLKLAKLLKKQGFNCQFVMTVKERDKWLFVENFGFKVPQIHSLFDLAKLIYESYAFIGNDSGPAHLASCLKLPVVFIGKKLDNLKYWQPSWHISSIVSPPSFIPNLKFFRLREKKWKNWITPKMVLFALDQLLKK